MHRLQKRQRPAQLDAARCTRTCAPIAFERASATPSLQILCCCRRHMSVYRSGSRRDRPKLLVLVSRAVRWSLHCVVAYLGREPCLDSDEQDLAQANRPSLAASQTTEPGGQDASSISGVGTVDRLGPREAWSSPRPTTRVVSDERPWVML